MQRLTPSCILLILANIVSAQMPPVIDEADSVMWTPAQPTSRDPITFTLWDALACCCRAYYGKSVWVDDTVVTLYFQYDDTPCQLCKCAGQGKTVEFPDTLLAAGTYAIYKSAQIYCAPDQACTALYLPPVRVGAITVRGPAVTVDRRPRSSGASSASVSFDKVILRIARDQVVTVTLFDARGASPLTMTSRFNAGTHTLRLTPDGLAPGVRIVEVRGEEFRECILAGKGE